MEWRITLTQSTTQYLHRPEGVWAGHQMLRGLCDVWRCFPKPPALRRRRTQTCSSSTEAWSGHSECTVWSRLSSEDWSSNRCSTCSAGGCAASEALRSAVSNCWPQWTSSRTERSLHDPTTNCLTEDDPACVASSAFDPRPFSPNPAGNSGPEKKRRQEVWTGGSRNKWSNKWRHTWCTTNNYDNDYG